VDDVPVVSCHRRGAAIDLVLDRPRQNRSQFVFTETRGRSTIFWQTRTVAMKANPGGRVPQRRALVAGFTIHVDTREKYAFRFARRDVAIEHTAIEAGDYGVRDGDRWLAVVERKSMEDLIGSLSSGTLAYQLAAMAELPIAAVVVEGRYPKLFELPRVKDGWLPDVLARLQIRYREIPIIVFEPIGGLSDDLARHLVASFQMAPFQLEEHRSDSTRTRTTRPSCASLRSRHSTRCFG
jgi:hypothetical protein